MRVLITGGAGYIGSHTVLALLEDGNDVHVVDNLSNSSTESLHRVARLAGRKPGFDQVDLLDEDGLDRVMREFRPEAVMHFAGLKSVGESVADPLKYYRQNVNGTVSLLRAMERSGVRRIVFSSSATVYGVTDRLPIQESAVLHSVNPYGRTKLLIEQMLEDVADTHDEWSVARLRYFNPVGAHPSGMIGEDPAGPPNNLMPFVSQVAVGRRPRVNVYGGDYPTSDGTGVRDYIHVVDLAHGHLAALNYITDRSGVHTWNLGTGSGTSVLEVINAFAQVSGKEIPYHVTDRRPGDAAASFADPEKARRDLGWSAKRGLRDIVTDAWRWQSKNPDGFRINPDSAV